MDIIYDLTPPKRTHIHSLPSDTLGLLSRGSRARKSTVLILESKKNDISRGHTIS